MKPVHKLYGVLVLALLASGGVVFPAVAQQQDAAAFRKQLIGSYKLISYMSFDQNGTATKLPYSGGQIYYDAAGRMGAQLMRADRPRMSSPSTEAERAAAYGGFVSYYGSFTVDAEKRSVTHHVEGSMSPNMVTQPLTRYVEFSPDNKSLFLSVKNGDRVAGRLQWDRY